MIETLSFFFCSKLQGPKLSKRLPNCSILTTSTGSMILSRNSVTIWGKKGMGQTWKMG